MTIEEVIKILVEINLTNIFIQMSEKYYFKTISSISNTHGVLVNRHLKSSRKQLLIVNNFESVKGSNFWKLEEEIAVQ